MKKNAIKCPYCNSEMVCGGLFAPSEYGVYWFPEDKDYDSWRISRKGVERQGGIVLDELHRFGFVAKAHPQTWCCRACNILITKL